MSVHRPRSAPWLRREAAAPAGAGVELVDDLAAWDRELSRLASPAPLNQSAAWGELQSQSGWSVHRIRFPGLGAAAVQVPRNAPVRWGFVPRGPVACTPEMLAALVDWARTAGLARIRIEPDCGRDIRPLLESFGFKRVSDVQPSHTRIVPLRPEEEMLASFRRSTRYNIGYAERQGVVVACGAGAEELAHHVAASASRAGVNLPGVRYLRRVLDTLPQSRTFVARHEGESLCALIVAVHDGRGYYLYSGADGHKRNLKPMDLALWCGMRYAAAAGAHDFDLWGVAPDDDPRHPWQGFTEFKRGFGGDEIEYAGTWDLVLSAVGGLVVKGHELAVKAVRRIRHA